MNPSTARASWIGLLQPLAALAAPSPVPVA